MATNRKVEYFTGFGRSDKFTVTITTGNTTATAADLLRGYSFFMISCADCSKIQAGTKLRFQTAGDTGDTPIDLWNISGSSIFETGTLPTSGTFKFMLTSAFGEQLIKPVLTASASGGSVLIDIVGFDPTIQGT